MKKKTIIIILITTNILSLLFAIAQNTIANKQMELAEMNAKLAMINADSAKVATERARQQRLIAEKIMVDLQIAKAALADCK